MNADDIQFKISAVDAFYLGDSAVVHRTVGTLKEAIIGLKFPVAIGNANSDQFESRFDQSFAVRLRETGWTVLEDRDCPEVSRPEIKWAARPDLMLESADRERIVVEVEKSNKFKIWDDLMKLWLLTEAEGAGVGLLVCPTNYASRKADWDLFAYARRCMLLLQRAAEVPAARLSRIAVVGYTQDLLDGLRYVRWDRAACRRLKSLSARA